MTLAWGIAATGRIARDVGAVLASTPGMRVAAVGSRDLGRAQALGAELGGRGHGTYAELVADPEVQAVYVATPHAQHAEVVEPALRAGKAVLCEKPMTHSLGETERLVAIAAETGTFLMEAVWSRFNPLEQRLLALVRDGSLGEVRSVHAAFGFAAEYDESSRLWDPALGGGALLDVGIYAVDLARCVLGEVTSVQATGVLAPNGVDAEAGLLLGSATGAHALLTASLRTLHDGTATVTGSLGRARLGPRFHAPTRLVVERDGRPVEEHLLEDRTAGFTGEALEVARCVAAGLAQSPVMPLAETVATMRVLERARSLLGALPA